MQFDPQSTYTEIPSPRPELASLSGAVRLPISFSDISLPLILLLFLVFLSVGNYISVCLQRQRQRQRLIAYLHGIVALERVLQAPLKNQPPGVSELQNPSDPDSE